MKPSKFLLNPVRALNFFGGGRSWSRRGDEGGGALVSFLTVIFVLLVCIN